MAAWTTILVAYLVGGVTFVPLLVASILFLGYYNLPYQRVLGIQDDQDEGDIVHPGDDTTALDEARRERNNSESKRANTDIDVAAGYFAVCREYIPMGINAKPVERSTPIGSATVTPTSPSVYQTMYRSIFDRKAAANSMENNSSVSQRPKKAGNVFYVVLRHGHLMLFDDEEQLEVRHVISLAHHRIGIYSGGDVTPEGELFIKRNAISLTRKANEPDHTPDNQGSKPFYLFSENCSAKEDFYFAMLKNQQHTFGVEQIAPVPKHFDLKSIISLVQKLHSSEDQSHFRWINALIGRIFLGVYKTRDLESFIHEKITKKISRVKTPSFLTNIKIQQIDTGDAAPYLANLKLKDLNVEGECVVEADLRYTGSFRIEVAATARIDLGARFKVREVNLILAVVLRRLEGHVLFKIKPPPSNRIWFSFQTMPKLEMTIEPIEVFAETLVQPFWDDVPFFNTEHKHLRGGIFEGDDAVKSFSSQPTEPLAQAGDEKSQGMTVIDPLEPAPSPLEKKADRLGTPLSGLASSTSVDLAPPAPVHSPRIVKTSTEPIVGTEIAHADLFKPSTSPPDYAMNHMAALRSRSQDASPGPLPITKKASQSTLVSRRSSSSSKELHLNSNTDDDMNADHKLAPQPLQQYAASISGPTMGSEPDLSRTSTASSLKSQAGSFSRNLFQKREPPHAATSLDGEVTAQKRNTLAAVTNAAAQARQWGWNALQRQREAMRNNDKNTPVDLSQPMGRGQPLPPPGTPLPMPTNGGTKIGPVPTSKRRSPPIILEDPLALVAEDDHGAMPSPGRRPSPPRRRRQDSHQEEEEDSPNILIVAAPDDSQPNTPAVDDEAHQTALWNRDFPDMEQQDDTGTSGIKSTPLVSAGDAINGLEAGTSHPASRPIPPSPSALPEPNDDDDYSAWMVDD
ncbi:maintenance of mitochondrial morphology protein 1 domain-containing protein [Trichoderma breve]|uniref:Maintenance of mitochondrial morphology protein 1 domain-containing protein n=1 Tax=Trichoderma breve TaxID=2034170 RepID=A0A9W9EEA5_9HYPO|nr:maintenance of mitochondrial morphology protein 1 domain-containing protein [Trichoderma breve]KAJ4865120.1 maintenance of mitochondrial morphology protein 1 domain-containing protein [Trichoderma breve]